MSLQRRIAVSSAICAAFVYLAVIIIAAASPRTALKYEGHFLFGSFILGSAFFLAVYMSFDLEKPDPEIPKILAVLLIVMFGLAPVATGIGAAFGVHCFTKTLKRQCQAQVGVLESQLSPLVERLRSVRYQTQTEHGDSSGAMLNEPFFLVYCTLLSNDLPDLSSIHTQLGWHRICMGDLGRRLDYEVIYPVPQFRPKSVVVVATAYRETGRRIRLDVGSVPEFREYGILFVLDAETGRTVWRSQPFMGSPAQKPAGGPGITEYSSLSGDHIRLKEIKKALETIPWSGK